MASSLSQALRSSITTSNSSKDVEAPRPKLALGVAPILRMLLSHSALREWLKLLILGGALETCRRIVHLLYRKVAESFMVTAHFNENDASYDWMMVWLSKQPSWAQARDVEISTEQFGLNSTAHLVPGEEDDTSGGRKLAYLPSVSSTYTMWQEISLEIRILTRRHDILNQLLLEAKKAYMSAQENSISIYTSDSDSWHLMTTRPKRPLRSIILDPGVKDLLLDDAHDFFGHLDQLRLTEKCIALMEDIDAAFTHTVNRDISPKPAEPKDEQKPQQPPSHISLSGLLNALDGVAAQEGRILFATTNKYFALDAALCRPGRMDIHVEFKFASQYQAGELFRCFYHPDDTSETDKDNTSGTPPPADAKPISRTASETEQTMVKGKSHRARGPKISSSQLSELAKQFAESIPNREFSMASLQGYLMAYKTQPFEAVIDAPAWVEKERLDSVAKANAGKTQPHSSLTFLNKRERTI
ncbi:hypothetical protein BD779DRAFT_1670549 [Infundibulicybe gibba]|nr:hypothetical protein BD779DRAFT_1670549 [Infundibulicybe gibba]